MDFLCGRQVEGNVKDCKQEYSTEATECIFGPGFSPLNYAKTWNAAEILLYKVSQQLSLKPAGKCCINIIAIFSNVFSSHRLI